MELQLLSEQQINKMMLLYGDSCELLADGYYLKINYNDINIGMYATLINSDGVVKGKYNTVCRPLNNNAVICRSLSDIYYLLSKYGTYSMKIKKITDISIANDFILLVVDDYRYIMDMQCKKKPINNTRKYKRVVYLGFEQYGLIWDEVYYTEYNKHILVSSMDVMNKDKEIIKHNITLDKRFTDEYKTTLKMILSGKSQICKPIK